MAEDIKIIYVDNDKLIVDDLYYHIYSILSERDIVIEEINAINSKIETIKVQISELNSSKDSVEKNVCSKYDASVQVQQITQSCENEIKSMEQRKQSELFALKRKREDEINALNDSLLSEEELLRDKALRDIKPVKDLVIRCHSIYNSLNQTDISTPYCYISCCIKSMLLACPLKPISDFSYKEIKLLCDSYTDKDVMYIEQIKFIDITYIAYRVMFPLCWLRRQFALLLSDSLGIHGADLLLLLMVYMSLSLMLCVKYIFILCATLLIIYTIVQGIHISIYYSKSKSMLPILVYGELLLDKYVQSYIEELIKEKQKDIKSQIVTCEQLYSEATDTIERNYNEKLKAIRDLYDNKILETEKSIDIERNAAYKNSLLNIDEQVTSLNVKLSHLEDKLTQLIDKLNLNIERDSDYIKLQKRSKFLNTTLLIGSEVKDCVKTKCSVYKTFAKGSYAIVYDKHYIKKWSEYILFLVQQILLSSKINLVNINILDTQSNGKLLVNVENSIKQIHVIYTDNEVCALLEEHTKSVIERSALFKQKNIDEYNLESYIKGSKMYPYEVSVYLLFNDCLLTDRNFINLLSGADRGYINIVFMKKPIADSCNEEKEYSKTYNKVLGHFDYVFDTTLDSYKLVSNNLCW